MGDIGKASAETPTSAGTPRYVTPELRFDDAPISNTRRHDDSNDDGLFG